MREGRLRNVIKRIRHLESAFGAVAPSGVATPEIAFLIADIGDDHVTETAFDIDARGRLIIGYRVAERARVAQIKAVPIVIAGLLEVLFGRFFDLGDLEPSGDEKYRDVGAVGAGRLIFAFGEIEKIERGLERRRLRAFFPSLLAAGCVLVGEVAGAAQEKREVVLVDPGPIRQRGFVDIEDDGRLAHLRCAHLDPVARFGERFGDVGVVLGAAVIDQPVLDEIEVEGLREIDGLRRGGRAALRHLRRSRTGREEAEKGDRRRQAHVFSDAIRCRYES